MMTFTKSGFVLPTLLTGFWIAQPAQTPDAFLPGTKIQASVPARPQPIANSTVTEAAKAPPAAKTSAERDATERAVAQIVARKVRVQRLLGALDHIAEVSMQMAPERAARIEPVIVDLAEQTLDLTRESAIVRASTDDELDRIEATVARLVGVLGHMVEPEMSL